MHQVEYLTHEKNGYYSLISKELDRAHRQYITTLTLLQQIKQPSIKVNVKTKNAYIAENQQINASDLKPTTYENIDPQ